MAKTTVKKEAVSALKNLADLLKVNLNDSRIAIATARESATVRMYDGSIEAALVPTSQGTLYIESPRSPGVIVELVDHQKDVLAPADAIYQIQAFMPTSDSRELLNGHIATIYVGREGLILNDAGLRRASEVYSKKNK